MSLVESPVTSLKQLLELAKKIGTRKISVAVAQEKAVLQAIKKAEELGLIEAILVGTQEQITRLASDFGWQIPTGKIINEPDYTMSIRRAVSLVRDKKADIIMKGKATSADIYRVVLDNEAGLRTGRLLSQVVVFQVPGFNRLMLMSDASGFNCSKFIAKGGNLP